MLGTSLQTRIDSLRNELRVWTGYGHTPEPVRRDLHRRLNDLEDIARRLEDVGT